MTHPELLKKPPHSAEAEQSLLGGLLLDNQAFEQVSWITANAFYEDRHRRLWAALARLIESGRTADIVSVADALGDDIGKTGGLAYLGALMQNTPSALNIRRYAEIVQLRSVQRDLINAGIGIAEIAYSPGVQDVGPLLDEAEARIFKVAEAQRGHGSGPVDLQTLLARQFERIDQLYQSENKSDVTGVPTGFIDLDAKTSGLQPGDLIVIAGRPSMGKTALALNMAEYVAVDAGFPVAVFSMEMSASQLTNRLLGSIAKVDQQNMRTGRLGDDEWSRLSGGMERLHAAKIVIDDAGGLSVMEIRSRARRIKRQHGKLGLVVIDYLQLMEGSHKENRATEISEISRGLKALAKELDVPVIALSQLNRAVDQRHDRRPMMSDLRESGAIEQDADVILFIYRDEVYNPDTQHLGVAEVIIGKQRNGPIGGVKLAWLGNFTRFENYSGSAMSWTGPRKRVDGGKVKNFHDYTPVAAGGKE